MKKGNDISDEMMARYLSGKATDDEERLVLDSMEGDDEKIDDLLNIATGIELHKRQQRALHNRMKPIYWSAAAIIVIVLGSVLFFNSNRGVLQMESVPAYGEVDTIEMQDTISIGMFESDNLLEVE